MTASNDSGFILEKARLSYSSRYSTAFCAATDTQQYDGASGKAIRTFDTELVFKSMMSSSQQDSTNAGQRGKQRHGFGFKVKQPSQHSTQSYYCDVCKIVCNCLEDYEKHLIGQRHSKKLKSKVLVSNRSMTVESHERLSVLRCDVCNLEFTGNSSYVEHIRGSKHQKVLKLHAENIKNIPRDAYGRTSHAYQDYNSNKRTDSVTIMSCNLQSVNTNDSSPGSENPPIGHKADLNIFVGKEYIEELKKNPTGKIISYRCKLCEVLLTSPVTTETHLKGRRHRLKYKKVVCPDLHVDVKPCLRRIRQKKSVKHLAICRQV